MSRDPIDFKKARQLAGFTMLLHGAYGAGKTHILGDMLHTEGADGKATAFINIKGEDGYLSVADLDGLLALHAYTVDTFDDLEAALVEAKKANVRAIGLDGFHRLYPLAYRKLLGSDRLPTVGGNTNEWGNVHKKCEDLIDTLRYHASIVVCTSASDKSLDQLKGETHTTPNFPGRNAAGIAGHFDFVFYCDAEVTGPNKIRRKLLTAPVSKMVVRYRLPKPLPSELILPEGPGAWKMIRAEITKTLA